MRDDLLLPNLTPVQPPQPLTRRAIDHTPIDKTNVLVVIEYATGWIEAEVIESTAFKNAIPWLTT